MLKEGIDGELLIAPGRVQGQCCTECAKQIMAPVIRTCAYTRTLLWASPVRSFSTATMKLESQREKEVTPVDPLVEVVTWQKFNVCARSHSRNRILCKGSFVESTKAAQ